MWKWCVAISVFAVGLAGAADHLSKMSKLSTNTDRPHAAAQQKQVVKLERPKTRLEKNEPLFGRKTRIKADSRGHFLVKSKMNGRTVEVLVDTGASSVAINRSTARKLGIHLSASDFKYSVSTANGRTKAAAARIKRISIGKVTVNNVDAMVLEDRSLGGTLLGMSFLNQLSGFEIKNGYLLLTQ